MAEEEQENSNGGSAALLDVNVDIVFEPPWDPEKITEDGKKLLGID